MSNIQEIIYWCAKEGTGLWEIVLEIQSANTRITDTHTSIHIVAYPNQENISKNEAMKLLKYEYNFILEQGFYLLKSEKLYDNSIIEVLDTDKLLTFSYLDICFNENGPFYYLSDMKIL